MKQYIKSIDALRTISILAVVFIHTTTRTLEASGFDLRSFSFTLFLNQISRFAVPLFFIISGFLLEVNYSDEKINFLLYFKKRFIRVAVPYIFWSGIYYLFVYTLNQDNFIWVMITGNASYQLYFIPTLCIFYLSFPLLHKIRKLIVNKWVLIILLMIQIRLLYLDYFIKKFEFEDPIRITALGFFFFVIGMAMAHNREKIHSLVHKYKYILFPLTGFFAFYVFGEGLTGYLSTGNYLKYYSQWRPSVLIYTVLIGLILYKFFEKYNFQHGIISTLSKLSFLVFFVHVIVLEATWNYFGKSLFNWLSPDPFGKIVFDFAYFGIVSASSFCLAYVIHKIPKLNKITG